MPTLIVTRTERPASPKSWFATRRRIRSAKMRRPAGSGLGQQHDELLAAVSGHDVHRPLFPAQDDGELAQDVVAHQVAVRVVDLLETVDIHHQAGQHRAVPVGPLDFLRQLLVQRPPIEGLGERIGLGQLLHLLPAQHGVLEIVGLLERGHRGPDHLVGEIHVAMVERRVFFRGPQEEHAGGLVAQREGQRDGRPGRHRTALGLPLGTDLVVQRVGQNVLHQDDLAGIECPPDLGITLEVDPQVAQHGILVRRHDERVIIRVGVRPRSASTWRFSEAPSHPPHQDVVDLLRLERGRDFLEDVHHLGTASAPRRGPGSARVRPGGEP